MKRTLGVVSAAISFVAAGSAQAQTAVRQFRGEDSLDLFTKTLVQQCGAIVSSGVPRYPALAGYSLAPAPDGEFQYIGGGSLGGALALGAGSQDLSPMSRLMTAAEACDTSIAAGPLGENLRAYTSNGSGGPVIGSEVESWVLGLDALVLTTTDATANRCDLADPNADPADVFGAPIAFNSFKVLTYGPGGVAGSGGAGSPYTIQDWKDVLRILYAGADHSAGATQSAANRVSRCSSDLRRFLVSSWDNILQTTVSCGSVSGSCQASELGTTFGPTPGGIRHALRPDDMSGATDTFLALLGLAPVGGSLPSGTLGANEPLCNGKDNEDKDPIRVRATTVQSRPTTATALNGGPDCPGANLNEEVLGPVQGAAGQACSDAGLVSTIGIPRLIGTTNGAPTAANPAGAVGNRRPPTLDELYPTLNCTPNAFEWRTPPTLAEMGRGACPSLYGRPDCTVNLVAGCWDPRCPDGGPNSFGLCLTPVALESEDNNPPNGQIDPAEEARGNAHCINDRFNVTPGVPSGLPHDGRIWNRYLRAAPPGTGPTDFTSSLNPSPVLRNERGRDVQYAEFRSRARQRTMKSNSTATNQFPYENVAGNLHQTCRESEALRAIGCISATAECIIGLAARAVTSPALHTPAVAHTLGNPLSAFAVGPTACSPSAPDVPCLPGGGSTANPLLDAIRQPTGSANLYPLSRRLYVNSLVGFDNFDAPGDARWSDTDSGTLLRTQSGSNPDLYNEQAQFAQCLTGGLLGDGLDESAVLAALENAALVSRIRDDGTNCSSPAVSCVPGQTACEEFDEAQCYPVSSPLTPCSGTTPGAADAACVSALGVGKVCALSTPTGTGTCRDIPAGLSGARIASCP